MNLGPSTSGEAPSQVPVENDDGDLKARKQEVVEEEEGSESNLKNIKSKILKITKPFVEKMEAEAEAEKISHQREEKKQIEAPEFEFPEVKTDKKTSKKEAKEDGNKSTVRWFYNDILSTLWCLPADTFQTVLFSFPCR